MPFPGINLKNRFVNVSNMWDKKSLAFPQPSVSYFMERAGEEQKNYHDFGITTIRFNESLATFYPIY